MVVFSAYSTAHCLQEGTSILETNEYLALLLGASALSEVTLISGEGLIGDQAGSLCKGRPWAARGLFQLNQASCELSP